MCRWLGIGVEMGWIRISDRRLRAVCAHESGYEIGKGWREEGQDIATPRVWVHVHADGQGSY